jgi:hypothetical protein
LGLGYATGWANGADNVLVPLLNFPRDGVAAAPNGVVGPAVVVQRTDVHPSELLDLIDARDFNATVSAGEAAYLQSVLLSNGALRLEDDAGADTRLLGNLRRMFQNPGPQGTRPRLNAVARRPGSRAEALWGRGATVTEADISAARAAV